VERLAVTGVSTLINLSNNTRMPFAETRPGTPVWSPDDHFIDFSAAAPGLTSFRKPSDGAAPAT